MENIWKRLNFSGLCPKVPCHPQGELTKQLVSALSKHAASVGKRKTYKVLDIGASAEAELSLLLTQIANNAPRGNPLRRMRVTALDVAEPKITPQALENAGKKFRYVRQNAHSAATEGHHDAVILSAVLEYTNKENTLKQANKVLHAGGLLALILHAPDSEIADRLEREAQREKNAAQTLVDFHRGKIQEMDARLRMGNLQSLPPFFVPERSHHPHGGLMWGWAMDELFGNPALVRELAEKNRQLLESGALDDRIVVANAIRTNGFKNEEEVKAALEKCGFQLDKTTPYRFPNGPKFLMVTAFKKTG